MQPDALGPAPHVGGYYPWPWAARKKGKMGARLFWGMGLSGRVSKTFSCLNWALQIMNTESPKTPSTEFQPIRTGLRAEDIARSFRDELCYQQARFQGVSTRNDHYMALAFAVRDRLLQRW